MFERFLAQAFTSVAVFTEAIVIPFELRIATVIETNLPGLGSGGIADVHFAWP